MIKKIIVVSGLLFILSCNNNNNVENTNVQDSTSVSIKKDTILPTDTTNHSPQPIFKEISKEVIFIANGTEPGWVLMLYQDKFQFIGNYGKDSIEEKINIDIHQLPVKLQTAKLSFVIEKKNCIAMSGDTLLYSVRVKHDNKEMSGCGKFLK